jgi:hypothetical protein
MNGSLVTFTAPAIPPEVQKFAVEKGIAGYLTCAIELARRAFPSAALVVSLGQDAEDAEHRYIAIDAEVGDTATEELVTGQRIWSDGLGRVCPLPQAVFFVLTVLHLFSVSSLFAFFPDSINS